MDTDRAIRDGVVEFLRDECGLLPSEYSSSTPLFSSGLLDSFAMVALLSFAEQRFGVVLPLQDLTQDTVDTVDSFTQYVASRREAVSGA